MTSCKRLNYLPPAPGIACPALPCCTNWYYGKGAEYFRTIVPHMGTMAYHCVCMLEAALLLLFLLLLPCLDEHLLRTLWERVLETLFPGGSW